MSSECIYFFDIPKLKNDIIYFLDPAKKRERTVIYFCFFCCSFKCDYHNGYMSFHYLIQSRRIYSCTLNAHKTFITSRAFLMTENLKINSLSLASFLETISQMNTTHDETTELDLSEDEEPFPQIPSASINDTAHFLNVIEWMISVYSGRSIHQNILECHKKRSILPQLIVVLRDFKNIPSYISKSKKDPLFLYHPGDKFFTFGLFFKKLNLYLNQHLNIIFHIFFLSTSQDK
jgi:hypothetical protein